jgi:hypothetical protein
VRPKIICLHIDFGTLVGPLGDLEGHSKGLLASSLYM